jgi:flagellar biogenesis protein FliO
MSSPVRLMLYRMSFGFSQNQIQALDISGQQSLGGHEKVQSNKAGSSLK